MWQAAADVAGYRLKEVAYAEISKFQFESDNKSPGYSKNDFERYATTVI